MPTYVALLRAVNVGGRNPVAMADLRHLLAEVGLADGQSLLQSGNLVFRDARRSARQLERVLEAAAARRLGLETNFFVRSAQAWRSVVARNPFSKEARHDPGRLLVIFLKRAPGEAAVRALRAAITGRERLCAAGRHLYVVYPDGVGRSRLTGALIERQLGTRGTGRNWNTVRKLGALAGG